MHYVNASISPDSGITFCGMAPNKSTYLCMHPLWAYAARMVVHEKRNGCSTCCELRNFHHSLSVLWFLKARSNLPPPRLTLASRNARTERIANKYGPIISLRLGMILISSPELTKEVFTTHDLNFASRPYMVLPQNFSYNFAGAVSSPHGERKTPRECKDFLDIMLDFIGGETYVKANSTL
ncbi:cytochrome P450 CYP736A12-like [Selaginella moellendorffii]|uniref:cytochrome P450 CYP736A12-like n=1 Tax=Selaginella moellendorffii TaxID=88036 RepID=UPI000D1C6743|nr:cytochrome P450 CYP736A12-like [Selaginella moellendorffii]|eukprot:XP_024529668.1 cytochrome P450 CYP736A12-like [Selaginella moellendorffii]